jgi:sulfur-oxidizing protein SoxA
MNRRASVRWAMATPRARGRCTSGHRSGGARLWGGVLVAAMWLVACASDPVPDPRRSGFDFMSPSTQAMQRDDTQNPGMLWVQEGASLWDRPAGRSALACVDCHGPAAIGMRGVATRYPAFDAATQQAMNLGQRINQCRAQRQQAGAFAAESQALLGLESFVAMQSRGLPVSPQADARLASVANRGAQLFGQRMGQLDLSCAQCHDLRAGQRLGGSVIPQAHSTGYPVYRLEWQAVGSLQRRIRNCMTGVRAEPFAYGAPELVALELHLAARARGLPVETPAVRP